MPIYAFECGECGHGFDRLQKLSDADPGACPSCGRDAVRRLVSAPSFRLAGSGWYETDFKSGKDTRRNLAGDGGGAASPKTPTAPATDATPKASKPAASGD